MVETKREVNGQASTEWRHYISSLVPDAQRAAEILCNHWGIENSLHRVLDVAFREDASRVRAGNAPENLAGIRKLSHNLLKHETTLKRGIKTKRLVVAWDCKYLSKILNVKESFE